MKKIVALLLSCVMMLSTLAIAATADTATVAKSKVLSEDFEDISVSQDYGYVLQGYTATDVSVELEADPADANNKVLAFQALANKPEASLSFPNVADADTYTVSFKYYFDYAAGVTGADDGYAGFRFGPNGSDWNNVARCFFWTNNRASLQVNAGGVKNPTAPETALALPVDEWVNVVITKVDNNTLTLSINGAIHTMVFDVNFAGKAPYFNFKADTQYQNKLLIDDLQVSKTVGTNTTTYDKQTFAETKQGLISESALSGGFKKEVVESPIADFANDPKNASNHCIMFRDNNAGANRMRLLSETDLESAYYTLTGKVYLEAINSGYHGVYFELANKSNSNCMQIVSNRADNYYALGETNTQGIQAMDAAKRWGVLNMVEGGELVPNGKKTDVLNCGEWISFELVRAGSNVALTVWAGNDKTNAVTVKNEFEALGTTPGTISLQFVGSGKNSAVYVDDLTLKTTADLSVAGVQTSAEVKDGKYAVRFLGGMIIDPTNCSEAGFAIEAKYVKAGAVATKQYTTNACKAYNSILESNKGVSETVTARDLTNEHLLAVSIYDIPATATEVLFKVDLHVINNGTTVNAETRYVRVTVSGTTVTAEMIDAEAYNGFAA